MDLTLEQITLVGFLKNIFNPTKAISKALEYGIRHDEELIKHLRSFAPGSKWQDIEALATGAWVEVSPGLMAKHVLMPLDVATDVTIMISKAVKDVCIRDPHCHMTDYGPKTQTTYVKRGSAVLTIHKGEDVLSESHKYSEGDTFMIAPNQYHTMMMEKGTKLVLIFTPAI